MAKWGEGDPRWIVEERADAKNVNNWHWTEKNATQWSIDRIKSLLIGYTFESQDFFVELTNVTKCNGEAIANNRKAKLIFFYEWDIEIEWRGSKKSSEKPTKFLGKIVVNNLSEEYSANELDFDVTCESSSSDANEVKEFLRKSGPQYLRKQLGIYITDLKHEYGKDLILPTKDKQGSQASASSKTPTGGNLVEAMRKSEPHSTKNTSTPIFDSLGTVNISMNEDFMCTPEDLYKVLVTEELTKMFTQGNATVQAHVGGKYDIFSGNVTGSFIELVPNKSISMFWRKASWPEGHQSIVKLDFTQSETGTHLKLTQTNVPASDKEGTQSGWPTHYFAPIQRTFGFGGRLF
uniref:Aha1_N domain-containing protein n=1 Tax=Mesocestoides corti TaxID=53468 RepID=A0A5K3G073_MESCO